MSRRDRTDAEDGDYLEEEETRGRKKADDFPVKRPEIDKAKSLPYPEWAPRFHKITGIDGQLVPFVLNPIQVALDAEWERQIESQGYVRMIVLKARKEGASSYFQGKAARACLEKEGWNVGIMAHEDSSCEAIFDRTKTFADELPRSMKRTLIKNNKKQIAYKKPHKSKVIVNVAKGKGGFGRGADLHIVHLSEVAFWKNIRGQSSAQGQASAIINSMPRVNGTAVLIESTANGVGNEFHSIWKKAVDGKNGFKAVFFGWQDYPVYRIAGKVATDFPTEPDWEAEEPQLLAMGIDQEQLAWRRWKIANDCNGDLDTFHQEYPARPEEAFLATGSPVFPAAAIQERYTQLEQRDRLNPTRRFSFSHAGVLEENKRGEVRFYRSRAHGELDLTDRDRYVIVADPAGAGASAPDQFKGDPACAYVWDRKSNEQIAEWHGWTDPDRFAQELAWLANFYGNPLLIVEAGAWGGHVISCLQRLHYPNLYFREQLGEQYQMAPTNWGQYGWVTSAKSKPQMVDALRDLWRNGQIMVNSPECCSEHLTFVKNGVKREAQSGCHDDRVMCCAIYAMWAQQHPYTARAVAKERGPETMGDIMAEMLAGENGGRGRWRLW